MARVLPAPPAVAVQAEAVPRHRVEAVLGGDHFVSLRLESWDQLAERRSIGPYPVDEYNALFGLFRVHVQAPARHRLDEDGTNRG